MSGPEAKEERWFSSLGRTVDSLQGLAHARLELLAVELQEQKLEAVKLLVWLGTALTFGVAGLLIAMGALALFLWSVAGYAGLIGLALAALAVAAAILWAIRQRLHRQPPPFEATLAEFRKDRECLKPTPPSTNSPTVSDS